jgi:phosphatidylserine/phosphatidylglycerophosphate/cardiolipin synthase-like enzyme
MRRRKESNGLTVNAIAGTHVVFFGLDLAKPKRPGFRGFGFKRFEVSTGEIIWLRGMKTFKETEPHPVKGEMFRSCDHPFQSFQWADYSVKPGQQYMYTIVAFYGKATDLKAKLEVGVKVTTELETGPRHSVFFNRGSVATQEYARRFENKKPSRAGVGAYQWLSRGLVEALIAFIGRATAGWELHAAVYEFQWAALFDPAAAADDDPEFAKLGVLEAIKAAVQRGAAVRVLYDDIEKHRTNKRTGEEKPVGPWAKNREAIAKAGIKSVCTGRRESSKIMHNKFFVLSKGGRPKAVWTGSTNLTENGIFGHSNLGHTVEDEEVAQAFLDYWQRLAADPKVDKKYRAANTAATALPRATWNNGTTAVFSPRGTSSDLDALDWYAEIAAGAKSGLFMTFAFGMNEKFKKVYRTDDQILRMALLEKEGNNPSTLAQDKKDIQKIRNRPNVVLAIGNRLKTNAFDHWLAEMDRVNPNVHVLWIHTKYMLVDPLGATPIVLSGSANFSRASTYDNDENMLIIRGDKRIADIYFGEYIRLYAHYAFREAVKWFVEKQHAGTAEEWQPQFLVDDDKWMEPYFDPEDKSARCARREYFAGPMSE